ncbi:hypothetical protein [Spongiactinospora gelatinilytica]|nr:hypothetical protein [Spongiactinospora gelatinilytica]
MATSRSASKASTTPADTAPKDVTPADTPDAPAPEADAPKLAPVTPAARKALLTRLLSWLTTKEDGTARPEKGWQLLCEKNPTIAEAISYQGTPGLKDRTRPGSGVITAREDHPADVVAFYPDGRAIVTRQDDGAWRLGVKAAEPLATRVLQLAELRKLVEAEDPQAKAEELAGAAALKAKEARQKDLERDLKEIARRQKASRPIGEHVKALREEWSDEEIRTVLKKLDLSLNI